MPTNTKQPATEPAHECGTCGQPAGDCYNLCPNSPAYYSPEQEYYDDQFYGMDDVSERYAAEVEDMRREAIYADYDDQASAEWDAAHPADPDIPWLTSQDIAELFPPITDGDIPF